MSPRPLLTRQAVRAVDRDAVERLGMPGLVLMENAGRGAADALLAHFGPAPGRVLLLGGPGQNGGDAWVVARHLHDRGIDVECWLVGERGKVRGDAGVNLAALESLGISAQIVDDVASLEDRLAAAAVLVDGLFGTGLDRPVEGRFAEVIQAMARSGRPIVALDLPSGVDGDTGSVLGVAAAAEVTVTFAARKRGLYQYPGASLAGEVVCASIGVPGPVEAPAFLIEPAALAVLAPRPGDGHKGKAGHVVVYAGSPGKSGAALLSARGAFRAGAGLVSLAPRPEAFESLAGRVLEAMTVALPAEGLEQAALDASQGMAAAVVGPGLGLDEVGRSLSRRLVRDLPIPAVVDADALSAHAGDLAAFRGAAAPRVLTPHPGEAARLLGISTADVQADRYAAAARLADESGQVAVLKGAGTVVAAPGGALAVCDRGTPALGVAGTGDVLAGALAGMLASSHVFEAAQAAVWLHARAGEIAADTDRGILASEVADSIPKALQGARIQTSR